MEQEAEGYAVTMRRGNHGETRRGDLEQRTTGRQPTLVGAAGDGEQRTGELGAVRGDLAVAPVAVPGHQRVVECVCPVLQLEVRTVRGGTPRRVDPGARRPSCARATSEVCSVPSGSTANDGTPR